jgi:3D (Asp-Asp-Asp) domain-containing protein
VKTFDAIFGPRSDGLSGDEGVEGKAAPRFAWNLKDKSVRRFAFALVLTVTACATASSPLLSPARESVFPPAVRAMAFALDAPLPQTLGPDLKLWATHYHTPIVTPAPKEISAAFPLIGRDGTWISPPLRHKDWCEAALQGSVSVREGRKSTAYVFVDANGPEQTNCDEFLGNLSDTVKTATRRARFKAVSHPLGCGVRNIPLMPFRTVAVDTSIIPIGSVIYVPELRGRAFRREGKDMVHDGYLFAGDRGGAIRGKHIDVFMIDQKDIPFEDIFASISSRTFEAHIVAADDPSAVAVRESQSGQCNETSVTPN